MIFDFHNKNFCWPIRAASRKLLASQQKSLVIGAQTSVNEKTELSLSLMQMRSDIYNVCRCSQHFPLVNGGCKWWKSSGIDYSMWYILTYCE